MKCSVCGGRLIGLYCRNGPQGKRWLKVGYLYCKKCKKIVVR